MQRLSLTLARGELLVLLGDAGSGTSPDAGAAVVVTTESAALAARHATTIALFVAGRLISWAAPSIALVPALQLLSVSCGSAARGSAVRPLGE